MMGPLPRSRPTLASLLVEVASGVAGRPVRSVLTAVGIAVGLAALIASIGLSQSAGASVVMRFNEAQEPFLLADGTGDQALTVDRETLHLVRNRVGVEQATRVTSHGAPVLVRARGSSNTSLALLQPFTVAGGDSHVFETIGAVFATGRPFDQGHIARESRVAVLGAGVARRIGLASIDGQPAVVVDGEELLVIGIVENAKSYGQILDMILIPETTAERLLGPSTDQAVLVRTAPNDTYSVAHDLPFLLSPVNPANVQVSLPPPPPEVAEAVSRDLDALTLALAAMGTLVAAISVTAIMTINVVERTSEIGLRRALGASRISIASQFLLESTLVGILGGLIGAVAGLGLTVAAAQLRSWTPILTPTVPYMAIGLGAVIGVLSGTYPATRASRVAPTTSLRA